MHNIELILAWIEYLTRQLNLNRSLKGLDAQLQRARQELESLGEMDVLGRPELQAALAELNQALQAAQARLDLLTQVQLFNQDADPHECLCKHARVETGVFYNSIKALQCFSCRGWQTIRKVIQ